MFKKAEISTHKFMYINLGKFIYIYIKNYLSCRTVFDLYNEFKLIGINIIVIGFKKF
jgi:hypothetical protein